MATEAVPRTSVSARRRRGGAAAEREEIAWIAQETGWELMWVPAFRRKLRRAVRSRDARQLEDAVAWFYYAPRRYQLAQSIKLGHSGSGEANREGHSLASGQKSPRGPANRLPLARETRPRPLADSVPCSSPRRLAWMMTTRLRPSLIWPLPPTHRFPDRGGLTAYQSVKFRHAGKSGGPPLRAVWPTG